jgi:hypothetical protein
MTRGSNLTAAAAADAVTVSLMMTAEQEATQPRQRVFEVGDAFAEEHVAAAYEVQRDEDQVDDLRRTVTYK